VLRFGKTTTNKLKNAINANAPDCFVLSGAFALVSQVDTFSLVGATNTCFCIAHIVINQNVSLLPGKHLAGFLAKQIKKDKNKYDE
jgi:hypothetical protein